MAQLSARNLLYRKLSDNLTENNLKDLRAMLVTDGYVGKARVEKATPHEIFNMLEDDGKIGKGNLGLLIQLLTSLGLSKLAEEAKNIEEKEKRGDNSTIAENGDLVNDMARLAVREDPGQDIPAARITEQQLNKLAGSLGSEWENLAIHLGMRKADVDRFKAENLYNMQSQVFAMLVAWKAKAGRDATVGTLLQELLDFGIDQDKLESLQQTLPGYLCYHTREELEEERLRREEDERLRQEGGRLRREEEERLRQEGGRLTREEEERLRQERDRLRRQEEERLRQEKEGQLRQVEEEHLRQERERLKREEEERLRQERERLRREEEERLMQEERERLRWEEEECLRQQRERLRREEEERLRQEEEERLRRVEEERLREERERLRREEEERLRQERAWLRQ